jgi:pimeloyl-ACP methyl ester carboxylesterase
VTDPRWLDVPTPDGQLRVLSWGPDDAPIALCLHGFPDTAHGWRKVAPQLVDAGWRVVAPFMRGYAPSATSADGSYHVGALMDDALRVLEAAGPTGRDVLIGHDWGAIAGDGLAAMPDGPFAKAVIMSVPPAGTFQRLRQLLHVGKLVAQLPRQLLRSWYIMYFQLPLLPERSAAWVVPRLWRQWSPSYDAGEDVVLVLDAIGAPENWRAALGYYRATIRGSKPPPRYAELHRIGCPPWWCRRSTCMVPTTAVSQRTTRSGSSLRYRRAAELRSSRAQDISCNWTVPTRWRDSSSSSSERVSPSSGLDGCGPGSAATADAGGSCTRRRRPC